MKWWLMVLLLLSQVGVWAQIPTAPNAMDPQGKRTGPWVILYDSDWEVTGDTSQTAYYRVVNYQNDLPTGKIYGYYLTGELQWEGTMASDRPDVIVGKATWYHKNGQVSDEGYYENGKGTGDWRFWDENGELYNAGTFLEGEFKDVLGLLDVVASYHSFGFLEEAMDLAQKTRGLIERTLGKESAFNALALTWIASVHLDQQQYALAEPLLLQALDIFGKQMGHQHPVYGQTLGKLGNLYRNLERYQESEEYLTRTIEHRKKYLGEEHDDYAMSIFNLALLMDHISRVEPAGRLYEQFLELRKTTIGAHHQDHFVDHSIVAGFYLRNRLFEQAESLLDKALVIHSRQPAVDSASYAGALTLLAEVYHATERNQEAEKRYQQCLDIALAVFGTQHETYYTYLTNLAKFYKSNGDYQLAAQLYGEAAEIRKSQYGAEHLSYVDPLISQAALYFEAGMYEQSRQAYQTAEPILEKGLGPESQAYLNFANNLGMNYRKMKYYGEAEAIFNKALDIYRRPTHENNPDYATVLNNLGHLYIESVHYGKAEGLLLESLEYTEKHQNQDHPSYQFGLNNLGVLYQKMGKYKQSEAYLTQALASRKNRGETHPDYLESVKSLAALYVETGQYSLADSLFKVTLDIEEELFGVNSLPYALTQHNHAVLKMKMGSLNQSEHVLIQVLNNPAVDEGHPIYQYATNNLGQVYTLMGRYQQAIRSYEEALEIRISGSNVNEVEIINSLNNLGDVYSQMENFTQAEAYFKLAQEASDEDFKTNNPKYAVILGNLANLYGKMGRLQDAEKLHLQELELEKQHLGEDHPGYAHSLVNLAYLYTEAGNYDSSESLHLQALGILREKLSSHHPDYLVTLSNLAILYEKSSQTAKAVPIWEEAVRGYIFFLNTTFSGLSEQEQTIFYQETIDQHFESFVQFSVANYSNYPQLLTSLYDLILSSKGILLRNNSQIRREVLESSDSASIKDFEQWQDLRAEIIFRYRSGVQDFDNQELARLEARANDLEKSLSRRSQAFGEWYQNEISWQQVQNNLRPGEAALEIVRFRHYGAHGWDSDTINYAALIIRDNSPAITLVNLPHGKVLEDELLSEYRLGIGNLVVKESWYKLFWEPIQQQLSGVNQLYFSPDGVYHLINPETLLVDDEEGIFLDDLLDIHTLGSTRDLVTKAFNPNHQSSRALLVGFPNYQLQDNPAPVLTSMTSNDLFDSLDHSQRSGFGPLPETKTEVEQIGIRLMAKGWTVNTLISDEAHEAALKSVVRPQVLHLATHGFFIQDIDRPGMDSPTYFGMEGKRLVANPLLRSGLLLAGAAHTMEGDQVQLGPEDGILTAYEVKNMDLLGTELVVLSACETGLGRVQNGEGVYGLQRAFQAAGAQAVLMSLWKVDDRVTREFMETFYQQWLSHHDKYKAYHAAKALIRENYPHPYYWGAFVMIEK